MRSIPILRCLCLRGFGVLIQRLFRRRRRARSRFRGGLGRGRLRCRLRRRGLGAFCRLCLGRRLCARISRLVVRRATCPLRRVVVHIPTRTLELKRGRSQRPDQRAMALGALGLRLRIEVLYFLEAMAALGAAIFVQRQSRRSLPRKTALSLSILPAGRQSPAACRPVLRASAS